MNIATLDWMVIGGYFVVITAIGLIAGYRVRQTGEYFLGGRRFGPWLMMGQSFGVGTHAEMPVALAGAVYSVGASAIWFQWKNLFITPFYWIMAPVFRRIRRTTMAELTEDRYGPWMAAIYIVFALCFFIINTGSMLKGAGKVISQATGGGVGANEIVVAMTVMFMLYSFVGGLIAAAWTDLFQGFLIIALSFMLVPLGLQVVGGLDGIQASLEPFRLSLATPSGIGPWMIAMLTINGLVGIMAQPHQLAAVGTGKDERTCRVGMFYGNMIKRVCTVGWALVGLIVAAMVVQGHADAAAIGDPENAFGFACRQLLFPGALGLMIASVLAANMSTCSAFLVDSGALFTEGLYRRQIMPGREDRHYLWVGRASGFVITMLGVLYAIFLIESVLYTFLLTETLATFVGISVLGGILWPRANRWGALASLLASLATNFALYFVTGQRLDHWDPNVFAAALAIGSIALVAVSLLTAPEPQSRIDDLFERLQTSSDSPASAPDRQPLLLVNLLHLRRVAGVQGWKAYREDLGGFAVGWLVVFMVVIATAVMLRM
jgi:Na+/proline symporter